MPVSITTAPADTIPSNRCLPLAEWPEQDRAVWAAALQPGDLLDPGGVASRWAVATQIGVVNGYGRWLSWLAGRGLLDPVLPAEARVTRERLRAYAVDLQKAVAPFTVAARIEQVGHALWAMVPHENWRWIQRAADRLRAQAVSVRDKRARLQSPEQLIGLGKALMAQGDDPASGSPTERATAYRDGLLIASLAHRPMRARNLAVILCGQHLVCRRSEWWLVFSAAETKTGPKTGQGLEYPFPHDLVPKLYRYLEVHWPVLLARGKRSTTVSGLWVSKHGTHMGYAAISHQVRQRTAAAFGRSLSRICFVTPWRPALPSVRPPRCTWCSRCAGTFRLGSCTSKGRCLMRTPKVVVGGNGVSGQAFVDNAGFRQYVSRTFAAAALDMESAAVAHVAYINRIPFSAFRSLSDLAGAGESPGEEEIFEQLASDNSALVVRAFLRLLP
jgi:hypothetical protein